jgi:hypothetical protein
MYVYIYICVCVCVCIYIYIYTHTYHTTKVHVLGDPYLESVGIFILIWSLLRESDVCNVGFCFEIPVRLIIDSDSCYLG